MAPTIKKRSISIRLPEKVYNDLKREAAEDGISFNMRVTALLVVGRRAESYKEREHIKITEEIQRLVKEEYKRQNQEDYINSDRERPLNRYEKEREQEPTESKSSPVLAGDPDLYSRIYDGLDQDELEEKAERYLRSNWHPAFKT